MRSPSDKKLSRHLCSAGTVRYLYTSSKPNPNNPILHTVKPETIENLARALEFPLLVRSVSSECRRRVFPSCFLPLIQNGKFWTSRSKLMAGAMSVPGWCREEANTVNAGSVLKHTVKTRIEEKCARTLEFPFWATRGGGTANSAPSWDKGKGIYEAPY